MHIYLIFVGLWRKQSGSCYVDVDNSILQYGKMETLANVSNVYFLAVYHMDFLPFPAPTN